MACSGTALRYFLCLCIRNKSAVARFKVPVEKHVERAKKNTKHVCLVGIPVEITAVNLTNIRVEVYRYANLHVFELFLE
jgi:hypothetical protein